MNTDRIDFISAYCDGWCDRCAYTSRCSVFAVTIATAMCGDEAAGLELAVRRPQPVEPNSPDEAWQAELEDYLPSPIEIAETMQREKERGERIEETTIVKEARRMRELAHPWLSTRGDALRATADPVLAEALEIAVRDLHLVGGKLYRALTGRQRHADEGAGDDHPVQNDWNGSAKVALICLERSEAAWSLIAQATCEDVPARIAELIARLRALARDDFPDAMSFIRQGFDEPGR